MEDKPDRPCPQWSSKSQFCSQIHFWLVLVSWLLSSYMFVPLQEPQALLGLQVEQKRSGFGQRLPLGYGHRLHEGGRNKAWMPCS